MSFKARLEAKYNRHGIGVPLKSFLSDPTNHSEGFWVDWFVDVKLLPTLAAELAKAMKRDMALLKKHQLEDTYIKGKHGSSNVVFVHFTPEDGTAEIASISWKVLENKLGEAKVEFEKPKEEPRSKKDGGNLVYDIFVPKGVYSKKNTSFTPDSYTKGQHIGVVRVDDISNDEELLDALSHAQLTHELQDRFHITKKSKIKKREKISPSDILVVVATENISTEIYLAKQP